MAANIAVDSAGAGSASRRHHHVPSTSSSNGTAPLSGSSASHTQSLPAALTGSPTTQPGISPPIGSPSQSDVASLIEAAGSVEAALASLWKEKSALQAHNGQLWQLVEKQRTALATAHKEVDRLGRDRDKYKHRLKIALESRSGGDLVGSHMGDSPRSVLDGTGFDDHLTARAKNTLVDLPLRQKQSRKAPPKPLDLALLGQHLSTIPKVAPPRPVETVTGDGQLRPSTASSCTRESGSEIENSSPKRSPPRGRRRTREDDELARLTMAERPNGVGEDQNANEPTPIATSYRLTTTTDKSQVHPTTLLSNPSIRPLESTPTIGTTQLTVQPRHTDVAFAAARRPAALRLPTTARLDRLAVDTTSIASVLLTSQPQTAITARFPGLNLLPEPPLTAVPRPESTRSGFLSPAATARSPAFLGRPTLARTVLDRHQTLTAGPYPGLPSSPRPTGRAGGFIIPPIHKMQNVALAEEAGPIPRSRAASVATNTRERADVGLSHLPPPLRSCKTGEMLPVEGLTSVVVRVSSSLLRPSRQSMMVGGRISEDEYVLLLGVHAKDDGRQLWRVEKTAASITGLHADLADAHKRVRKSHGLPFKSIDRSLFASHAPSKVDARRQAVNLYFSRVFALIIEGGMDPAGCRRLSGYLSTDVIATESVGEPTSGPSRTTQGDGTPINSAGSRRGPSKEGYLTKRGKNFGGWKTRYFVLDKGELRYYDVAGGNCLGLIVLADAQIGRQESDPDDTGNEQDGSGHQYRHAFVIVEGARKTRAKHVFCAESDEERDAWVMLLSWHVDSRAPTSASSTGPSVLVLTPKSGLSNSTTASPAVPSVKYKDTLPPEPLTAGLPPKATTFPLDRDRVQADEPAPPAGPLLSTGPPITTVVTSSTIKDKKRSVLLGLRNRIPRDARKTMTALSAPFSSHHHQSSGAGSAGSTYQPAVHQFPPFGVSIIDAVANAAAVGTAADGLPTVVFRCLRFLRFHRAEKIEGIFRLSGSSTLIKGLRERFNRDGDLDLDSGVFEGEQLDVHAVAGLLKLYFRELPCPALPVDAAPRPGQATDAEYEERRAIVTEALSRVPVAHARLLMKLMAFLRLVVDNEGLNRMNVRNVAIVFAPTLSIPSNLISTMIQSWEHVFDRVEGYVFEDIVSPDPPVPAVESFEVSPDAQGPRQAFTLPSNRRPSVTRGAAGPSLPPSRSQSRCSNASSRYQSQSRSASQASFVRQSGPDPITTIEEIGTTEIRYFDLSVPVGCDFTPTVKNSGIPYTPTVKNPGVPFPPPIDSGYSVPPTNSPPRSLPSTSPVATDSATGKLPTPPPIANQALAIPSKGMNGSSNALRSPLFRRASSSSLGMGPPSPENVCPSPAAPGFTIADRSVTTSVIPMGVDANTERRRRNSTLALLGLRAGNSQTSPGAEDMLVKKRGLFKRDRERATDMGVVQEEVE